jgi:molecular chaperone GrpE
MSSPEETSAGPVIRDLRRIDPATGQVRDARSPGGHPAPRPGAGSRPEQAAAGGPAAQVPGNAPAGAAAGTEQPAGSPGADAGRDLAAELAERTADLQRVTAEYANYRKRVERDRLAVREQALANVLMSLIPVLDDVGRAREHGELVGGFKSVAEALETTATKLGLVSYGEAGEPFDPNVHDALALSYSADVAEPVCAAILQPGYKVGERILRPARVAVAEPGEPAQPAQTAATAGADVPAGEAAAGQATGQRPPAEEQGSSEDES